MPISNVDYAGGWLSPYEMLHLFNYVATVDTNTRDVVICNPTVEKRQIAQDSFTEQVSEQGLLPVTSTNIIFCDTSTTSAANRTCLVVLRAAVGNSSQVFRTHDQVKSDFANGTNDTIKMLLATPNAAKAIIPICTDPFTPNGPRGQNCRAPPFSLNFLGALGVTGGS